jgi:hypothetical protein
MAVFVLLTYYQNHTYFATARQTGICTFPSSSKQEFGGISQSSQTRALVILAKSAFNHRFGPSKP